MLYKFINENRIEPFIDKAVIYEKDGVKMVTTNPTDELLKTLGYKPLVSAPFPDYDPNTQVVYPTYVENENDITQVINVVNISEE